MNIAGLTISGLLAFIFLLVGIFAVFGKKTIGQTIRGVLGMIPIGNPKLWGAILLVLGLAAGGFAYGYAAVSSAVSGGAVASFTGAAVSTQAADVDCKFIVAPSAADNTFTGITPRADSTDLTHYYVDVNWANGTGSVNGSISCTSNRADISKGAASTCYADAGSFRNEISPQTDQNTYWFAATDSVISSVPGHAYRQQIYLADNAAASTASDQEETQLVFAQDEKVQTLGYRITLPGATIWGYLNNGTARDVRIICDDKEVGKLTLAHTAG